MISRFAPVAALSVLLCAAGMAWADGVQQLTLADAVRLALERNRGFLNARQGRSVQRLRLEITEEDRWVPEFSVTPSVSRNVSKDSQANTYRGNAAVKIPVPTGGGLEMNWTESGSNRSALSQQPSWRLNFTQPLLRGAWPAIANFTVRKARIAEQINILGLRDSATTLIVSTVGAYRALVAADRQVEIAAAALRRARDRLTSTRALIEAGRVARREAVRFEATITNRELSLARARNARDTANLTLAGLLALDGSVRIRPLASLTVERRQVAYEPIFKDALRQRSDFRRAELGVKTARMALVEARDSLLPNVNFSLNVSRAGKKGPTVTELGLTTTIKLNDRQPELALATARLGLRDAERTVVERREAIGIAVRGAVNDVTVRLRLIELARGARALAESNFEIEKRKFGEGLVSSFEVAASADSLLQAEQAEVNAIVAYLAALTRLDRVSGRTLERWGVRLEAGPGGVDRYRPERRSADPETRPR